MNEIEFNFEELALIVEGGFEAGLINGTATIRYDPASVDGEWSVRDIALDGHRLRVGNERFEFGLFERKPVPLCQKSHPWLYGAIIDRLENGSFKDSIEAAIAQHIEDSRAEHRAQLGKDRARGLER